MVDKDIRQNKFRDLLPATGGDHINTLVEDAIKAMAVLREFKPRVHCITNTVAQNFTANILLACGAIPSMSVAFDEIADFTSRADALLVNLGTMDTERTKSVRWAVKVAEQNARPFVLDPVFFVSRWQNNWHLQDRPSSGPTAKRPMPCLVIPQLTLKSAPANTGVALSSPAGAT